MKKRPKMWVYSPPKRSKPRVPESTKAEVATRARELAETVLKPKHVLPPPEPAQFNYIVDIFTKWYRHYFYFCAKYACPGPYALEPFFEAKFARMEYLGTNNRFDLSFLRYTGEWIKLYPNLSLDECLAAIKDEPWFLP